MTEHKSIAVDGPSGAGKSTLAKLLAKELGFLYVDTGAIYRTVGLKVLPAGYAGWFQRPGRRPPRPPGRWTRRSGG